MSRQRSSVAMARNQPGWQQLASCYRPGPHDQHRRLATTGHTSRPDRSGGYDWSSGHVEVDHCATASHRCEFPRRRQRVCVCDSILASTAARGVTGAAWRWLKTRKDAGWAQATLAAARRAGEDRLVHHPTSLPRVLYDDHLRLLRES